MPRSAHLALLLLSAAAALAGCDASPGAGTFAARDSAGVLLADSRAPAWGEGEGWRVAAEPVLDLGAADGPAERQFFAVRGAARLSDGRIVVADGGSSTVRWYGAEGGFLFERGGEGGGPGEFQRLRGGRLLALPGDSVAVLASGRVVRFGPDGEWEQDPPEALSGLTPSVRLADGTWVALPSIDAAAPLNGSGRDTVPLLALRPGATAPDTLGRYPGAFRTVDIVRDGGGDIVSVMIRQAGYPGGAQVGGRGSEILVGTAAEHALDVLAPDGRLLRRARWAGPPLPVTEDDRTAYVEATLARMAALPDNPLADDPAALRQLAEAMDFPDRKPAYIGLRADPLGNVWVELDRLPGDEVERHLVLDPEGRLLGAVVFPERFRTLEIGADHVLGVWRDDLDVEHVRVHALVK